MEPTAAGEGLTQEFLESRIDALLDAILTGAESYFAERGTPASQNHPSLKKTEMLSRYYDYQACTISSLAILAERGSERALAVIRRILANARTWLDEGRSREGHFVTFRRSQLHMVLAYERLASRIEPSEAREWHELLVRTGSDVIEHFNGFREDRPQLDNRGFRTGINHVALAAESVWRSGFVLDRSDWQEASAGFVDRLLAYGHPDGYFEENTNDAREGGPSLLYTPLTSGSLYHVQRWRNRIDVPRFERIGRLYRQFTDTRLHPLPFADERANPHAVGPYGLALQSITSEGRGFLRLLLDEVDMSDHVSGAPYLQHMSRAVYEMVHMDIGPGASPEPFHEGSFRLSLPIGVVRRGPWTAGISTAKALNREISARSDYAIDRQSLFALSHATAGLILEGAKSKRDPAWSSVRLGEDAYPVRTGSLELHEDGALGRAAFETFDVDVEWHLAGNAVLVLRTASDAELTAQLPLEISPGTSFAVDDGVLAPWDGEATTAGPVARVTTERWQVETSLPGTLRGPLSPHNPYTDANRSGERLSRLALVVPWMGSVTFTVSAR